VSSRTTCARLLWIICSLVHILWCNFIQFGLQYDLLEALLANSTKMLASESPLPVLWTISDAENGASGFILVHIGPALMVMWTAKADKTLENEGKVLLENNTQEISLKTYSHRRSEVVFRPDETCFYRNATYPENVTNMRSGSFQNSSEMNPRRSYTGARNEFQNIVTQWRASRLCPRVSRIGS